MNYIRSVTFAVLASLSFGTNLRAVSYATYDYWAGLHNIWGPYTSSGEEGHIEGRIKLPYKGIKGYQQSGNQGLFYNVPDLKYSLKVFNDVELLTSGQYQGPGVIYIEGDYTSLINIYNDGGSMWFGWDDTWLVNGLDVHSAFKSHSLFNITKNEKMVGFTEGSINDVGFFSDGGLRMQRVYATPDNASITGVFIGSLVFLGLMRRLAVQRA